MHKTTDEKKLKKLDIVSQYWLMQSSRIIKLDFLLGKSNPALSDSYLKGCVKLFSFPDFLQKALACLVQHPLYFFLLFEIGALHLP